MGGGGGGAGRLFPVEFPGADAVDGVFVEEPGAFFFELAAGEQEGDSGRKGDVSEDLVAEFSEERQESYWHFEMVVQLLSCYSYGRFQ